MEYRTAARLCAPRAQGALLLCAVEIYWGLTTVFMQFALAYTSSATYIMLRFTIAGGIMLLLFSRRLWANRGKRLLLHGFLLGVLQLVPMECTVLALNYTSASNSIFIAQLAFILVPLMECAARRKLPGRFLILTACGLLIGLAVFTNVSDLANPGNLICFVAAVFNSLSILAARRFTRQDSPLLLGAIQVISCGVLSIPVWLLCRDGVRWCGEMVLILFLTAAVGSAGGYLVYLIGQSRSEPVTVSFLSLLQPVFAMVGAALIRNPQGQTEPVAWHMVAGTAIILSVLVNYIRRTHAPAAGKAV